MSMYIASLRDKVTGATILPRSVIQSLSDVNGNTLDSALLASDINVLANGKVTQIATTIESLSEKIPDVPDTDGTYVLKATISDGAITYSWVAE